MRDACGFETRFADRRDFRRVDRGASLLDGVYGNSAGEPIFREARAPSVVDLEGLLNRIIQRIVKLLTRTGYLIKEQGMH